MTGVKRESDPRRGGRNESGGSGHLVFLKPSYLQKNPKLRKGKKSDQTQASVSGKRAPQKQN